VDTDSKTRIEQILNTLCRDIGIRLAGSQADEQTIKFLQSELSATGADVSVEQFPVLERHVKEELLEIFADNAWQPHDCSLFSSTPGTDGSFIEAPLCFFASPAEYANPDLSHLRGKAVVHLGCHIESRDQYRRLMAAQPSFLLMTDIRYPGSVPLADGMFPSYTKDLGAIPTVNVAYQDAWKWKVDGAEKARLRVSGGMRSSSSGNVIAEFPGRDSESEILFVGGHHDTQAGSPGADDNGTGTAAVIELARLLAPLAPFRRSVRLISFGAEEQLSVGSADYVRRHRSELTDRSGMMLNFDSFGSHLGWFELTANGPLEMANYLLGFYENNHLYMKLITEMVPYADHFPFVAAGIPSAYIGRSNCTSGRFFHHRPDDDIHQVSTEIVAEVVGVSAKLLAEMANRESLPFPSSLPQDQSGKIATMWEDLFGGWSGV